MKKRDEKVLKLKGGRYDRKNIQGDLLCLGGIP
jgi:hypothetical protein